MPAERETGAFHRAEDEAGIYCDRIVLGGFACDASPEYEVIWREEPGDLGTVAASAVCRVHAVEVDRTRVRVIRTHPITGGDRG